ncbi:hypothetical protein DNTS_011008, partial [Danionella cerebrum]
ISFICIRIPAACWGPEISTDLPVRDPMGEEHYAWRTPWIPPFMVVVIGQGSSYTGNASPEQAHPLFHTKGPDGVAKTLPFSPIKPLHQPLSLLLSFVLVKDPTYRLTLCIPFLFGICTNALAGPVQSYSSPMGPTIDNLSAMYFGICTVQLLTAERPVSTPVKPRPSMTMSHSQTVGVAHSSLLTKASHDASAP